MCVLLFYFIDLLFKTAFSIHHVRLLHVFNKAGKLGKTKVSDR